MFDIIIIINNIIFKQKATVFPGGHRYSGSNFNIKDVINISIFVINIDMESL